MIEQQPSLGGHLPGLDALRAIAVGAVVLFHLGLAPLRGGFLGVSLFFTLSGFLITRNLLSEVDATGTMSLRTFWRRRARRLFPAAWFVLASVAAVALVLPRFSQDHGYRGADVVASLLCFANWQLVVDGSSYAALFEAPSPVVHYWSLAIEEQSYVLIALLVAVICVRCRSNARNVVMSVAAGIAVVSWLLPLAFSMSVERTYYGTDTRIGEIAAGVVLACLIHRRSNLVLHTTGSRWAWTAVGVVAFGALAGTVTASSTALSHGLLPAVSVVSCLLVVSAIAPGSPLARLGGVRPVAAIGRLSYVIYLVHWPVIVFFEGHESLDLRAMTMLLAATLAAAAIVATMIERPIRFGHTSGPRVITAGGAALLVIIAASTWGEPAPTSAGRLLTDLETASTAPSKPATSASATGRPDSSGQPSTTTTVANLTTTTVARPTVTVADTATLLKRISVTDTDAATPPTSPASTIATIATEPVIYRAFGDSVLLSVALSVPYGVGLSLVQAEHDMELGCGIVDFEGEQMEPECLDRIVSWSSRSTEPRPDLVVIMSCQWELVDRRVPGSQAVGHAGEPEFDAFVEAQYQAAIRAALDSGVETVLWVRCPNLSEQVGMGPLSPRMRDSRDPMRVAAINALVERAVAAFPGRACTVPFDTWVNRRTDDAAFRPDGSHIDFRHADDAGTVFAQMTLARFESSA